MEFSGTWSRLCPHVHRALAASYVSAKEPAKAIKALRLCSSKFPTEADIYLRTAQLQAQETDYASVTETLREAVDNVPALNEDWRISSLVAVGEIAQGGNLSMPEVDPEKREIIVSLLGEYWRPFGKLSTRAQDEWVIGTYLLHLSTSQKAMAKTLALKGLTALAVAVEIELVQRVFEPLRRYFCQDEQLHRLVREGLDAGEKRGQNPEMVPFCQFVAGDQRFAIGFASKVLRLCQHPKTPVFMAVREWFDRNHPRLPPLAGTLDDVRTVRNRAVHGGILASTTVDIPEACREIIESLL